MKSLNISDRVRQSVIYRKNFMRQKRPQNDTCLSNDFEIKNKIREYYLNILEREPDEEGLNNYFNEIRSGLLAIQDLPNILRSSKEFKILQELKKGYTTTKEGFNLFLDPDDVHISRIIALTGTYEPVETEFLKKIVKTGMNVVDIGANIGFYTVLFSNLVGLQGKVTAFEPSPRSFHILEKNLQNCSNNVTIINKAVSDHTGRDKFYLSKENAGDNRFSGSVILDTDWNRESVEVDVVRLDNYFQDEYVDLIKIDAQGAEMKILNGGMETINNSTNLKIIVEFWPIGLLAQGTRGEDFLLKLKRLGFEIYELDKGQKKATVEELCSKYKGTSYANLYCVKS